MYEVNSNERERAVLVALSRNNKQWETEEHLEELTFLADTAGAEVVDKLIQEKEKIDPAYFIGRGKAEMLSNFVHEQDIDVVIFDDDLSPAQARNLEKLTDRKVLDRSGLILDIFARRAKTKEARTQVELAQLNYLLPRLTRQWTHLSRQVGGIGTRGPGETQLEVDRRMIRNRIDALSRQLQKIKKQREVRRQNREITYKVALVGYTNAGKSTLLNALTNADVFVENRLFATLDATIRRMQNSNQRDILLIDTVGFIRKLPHHLVASFMSTLEEARVADLLLHVVDVSHPQLPEQLAVVNDVLNQLQISDKPILYAFNKIDQLEYKGLVSRLKNRYQPSVFISATKGLFLEDLKKEIENFASENILEMEVQVSLQRPELIPQIYRLAEVLDINYNQSQAEIKLRTSKENKAKIQHLISENNGPGSE
ncbi:GTPase HflX [candidate division KSB1 bacterium]|nr:GTPase HflX [candidate division KSB1 bacterium]NIR70643.1 GTPase HflX [candidate division KSB1 bacterium]NIS24573.1 GTPase HflX [candidate division KSB1 bacterium]NIT71486.1 GTPase HflX [candidate division KSB1 bacterium]NIU25182.1 GTPase HflX [candidate division KSB1 bacterium]